MGLFFKDEPAMERLKQLTDGIFFLNDDYERKVISAGLTIEDAYEIREEVKKSIKEHQVEEDGVEARINFLIEQRKKAKGLPTGIDENTKQKLFSHIYDSELEFSSKNILRKEVREGKIKDVDTLFSRIGELKEREHQKALTKEANDSLEQIKFLNYIDKSDISDYSKVLLKNEVQNGKIKEMDILINKVYEIKQAEQQEVNSKEITDSSEQTKLLNYIDKTNINYSSKVLLKNEVMDGKIKDMGALISQVENIREEERQKLVAKNKSKIVPKSSSSTGPQEGIKSSDSVESQEKQGDEGYEVIALTPEKLAELQKVDLVKEIKFLLNQEHNLLKCPNCGVDFLRGNKFCYNCGFDILKFIQDLESGKIKISEEPEPVVSEENKVEKEKDDVGVSKKDSKSPMKESTEPKQKSTVSAATKRAINLKFASVVFLNEKSKNPTKIVKESYYKNRYDTRLAKIKKSVREEGYLVDGDPLTTARTAKVDDLKKVLKKHDLMVSGTKDELLQRLGENLSEEELKKAFPKKSLKVTDKGLEFIEKNKYVFSYDQITPLRNRIPIEEYDSIFEGVEVSEDKEILDLIEGYLNERGDSLANIIN